MVREEESLENGLNAFMKDNPSKFYGVYDPKEAQKWLQEVEKVFVATHCRKESKVTYVAFMLVSATEA